jgi:hypothetical protein
MEADDFASAIGVDGHGDYRSNRHDAAALALLQVDGGAPQIPPLAPCVLRDGRFAASSG